MKYTSYINFPFFSFLIFVRIYTLIYLTFAEMTQNTLAKHVSSYL